MPRRPILKDSRVVQLVFERELYERLKEAAMRQGQEHLLACKRSGH